MKKAFTLIELLVVIAIIAILAGMLMPALARARDEARKAACKGNQHSLGLSYAMYRNEYMTYPLFLNGDYRQRSDENTAALYPIYLEAIGTMDCPGGNPARAEYVTGAGVDPIVTGADYTQDDAISGSATAMRVVLADRMDDGSNHTHGVNCLFKDAHVQWSSGIATLTGVPNPEYPDYDARIFHYDGGDDVDGDGFNTASAGVDDASLEGDVDADDGDVAVH